MIQKCGFEQLSDDEVMVLRTIHETSEDSQWMVTRKLTSSSPTKLAEALFAEPGESTFSARDVRAQHVRDLLNKGWIVITWQDRNAGVARYDVSSEAKEQLGSRAAA